ncbi:hypothetical protein V6N13_073442 [Hibiscus sabdariffa]
MGIEISSNIELDNKVMINWLENSLQRPWSIAKYIAEIDSLACGCANVQFKLADIPNLAMADSLALNGLSRTKCFVSGWFRRLSSWLVEGSRHGGCCLMRSVGV